MNLLNIGKTYLVNKLVTNDLYENYYNKLLEYFKFTYDDLDEYFSKLENKEGEVENEVKKTCVRECYLKVNEK
ncbi:hypothetical protein ACRPOS_004475 [Bartonella heixiaziensis]|uniref:hypothetical protein n=1 Tax=Bartonella heixiaziensis TaxID=1461000 RepID=UPI003908962D